MRLDVRGLAQRHGQRLVFSELSLSLADGEIGALLGPSGVGKTSLLRAIAGFDRPHAGSIHGAGRSYFDDRCFVPVEQRGVGFVFQDLALFPHLTVADNIGFGLRGLPTDERRRRVQSLLSLVGLADRGGDRPHQLSGGMQQRVAVARALAPRPGLLLLDEPFSSLDSELRSKLAAEVRAWLKASGTAALLVTHARDEALCFADRVGVMSCEGLDQYDRAEQLWAAPATVNVVRTLAIGELLDGVVRADGTVMTELGEVKPAHSLGLAAASLVTVLVRNADLRLGAAGGIVATVSAQRPERDGWLLRLRLPSGAMLEVATASPISGQARVGLGDGPYRIYPAVR